MLPYFVVFALAFRLAMLAVSAKNEQMLRRTGAVEIGARNTRVLIAVHLAFYLGAVIEAWVRVPSTDTVMIVGVAFYLFGAAILLLVVRTLGRLWTVRLLLAPDHELVRTSLFRYIRHPNYFLNILPELIGLALALHAWMTLAIGLPLYAIPLAIRIRQEERAMRDRFDGY